MLEPGVDTRRSGGLSIQEPEIIRVSGENLGGWGGVCVFQVENSSQDVLLCSVRLSLLPRQ